MSASRVAPAGSSTNLPWVTRQASRYRSRVAGSRATMSSSRRCCSRAARSASALRWSPALATVRWYSGPNCSCSRPVRRRCPSTTASSTITTRTTRIAITMPTFMAAPLQTGRDNPSSNALRRAYPEATASNEKQTPRPPGNGCGRGVCALSCAAHTQQLITVWARQALRLPRGDASRLSGPGPRPGCVRLGLELAVDPDVGPLVVEGDQVGGLGALRDRERVAPGDVLLDRVADRGRPVAGRPLVGALGLAGRRQPQVYADT